jgi:hypothetical protein
MPEKSGGGNSAKIRVRAGHFNPGTDAETGVEMPPTDRHCQERPPAGVPRFAAAVVIAGWPAVTVPGKAAFLRDPAHAATGAATDRAFPKQKAGAIFPRRL